MPEAPFTMDDVKIAKKMHRCVKYSKDEHGNIYEISWKEPCSNCGKYHHLFSKAQKRCSLKIAAMVYVVLNDVSKGVDDEYKN